MVFGADVNSNIIPNTDDAYDLGTATQEWRNIFIDGTAHIDTLDIDENATITGTLGVTNTVTFNDTLGVTGATTLNSTLGVGGVTTLNDQLNVNAPVEIAGASSFIHLPDDTEIHVGTGNDLSRILGWGHSMSFMTFMLFFFWQLWYLCFSWGGGSYVRDRKS